MKVQEAPSAFSISGSASGLLRYTSTVPQRAIAMSAQLNQFRTQVELQRSAERMSDCQDSVDDHNRHHPMPRFDIPAPFQMFNVEIRFDHPYLNLFTADMGGPSFDNTFPDVKDYLWSYQKGAAAMERLAKALMKVAFPGASEQTVDPAGLSV